MSEDVGRNMLYNPCLTCAEGNHFVNDLPGYGRSELTDKEDTDFFVLPCMMGPDTGNVFFKEGDGMFTQGDNSILCALAFVDP